MGRKGRGEGERGLVARWNSVSRFHRNKTWYTILRVVLEFQLSLWHERERERERDREIEFSPLSILILRSAYVSITTRCYVSPVALREKFIFCFFLIQLYFFRRGVTSRDVTWKSENEGRFVCVCVCVCVCARARACVLKNNWNEVSEVTPLFRRGNSFALAMVTSFWLLLAFFPIISARVEFLRKRISQHCSRAVNA